MIAGSSISQGMEGGEDSLCAHIPEKTAMALDTSANDTSEVSLARTQVGQSRRAKTRAPGPQSALKNNRVEKN